MTGKVIATVFLGLHFIKTVLCRLFRIRRRGLKEFREDYRI